jgi:molecular chaperone GrpE (heat shock protein)
MPELPPSISQNFKLQDDRPDGLIVAWSRAYHSSPEHPHSVDYFGAEAHMPTKTKGIGYDDAELGGEPFVIAKHPWTDPPRILGSVATAQANRAPDIDPSPTNEEREDEADDEPVRAQVQPVTKEASDAEADKYTQLEAGLHKTLESYDLTEVADVPDGERVANMAVGTLAGDKLVPHIGLLNLAQTTLWESRPDEYIQITNSTLSSLKTNLTETATGLIGLAKPEKATKTVKEKREIIKNQARADFMLDMLPLLKSIKAAQEVASSGLEDDRAKLNDYQQAVKTVVDVFNTTIFFQGFEKIETVGEEYDPKLHVIPSRSSNDSLQDKEDTRSKAEKNEAGRQGTRIVEELAPGYKTNGFIIPATVRTA